ncbi:MAG TPA: flap endonuclease, partial [Anaeromyxobacteraceae bacterium]|nr:flap endonuclease [Anaeromyxobacteraceae bacterium]
GAARLARTLDERREDALLYRRLATLVRDVPLRETFDDLRWGGVPRQRFQAWCASAGAGGLLRRSEARPLRWAP